MLLVTAQSGIIIFCLFICLIFFCFFLFFFFFSSRRRHTRWTGDWSSDVCSSDLGQAGEALTAAFTSSFVGALFAVILITLVAPLVAKFALQFGPAEKFGVYFLAFCSFVGMSKEPPFKTVASMMIGFALAAVGLDSVTGQLRLTFGFTELLNGFDFLIAVIGLFGIGEILLTMEEGLAFRGGNAKIDLRVVLKTWKELPAYWMTSL